MFRSDQILTPHKLIKNFGSIISMLTYEPQAILITPKRGERVVLVSVDIFEELMEFKLTHEIEKHKSSELSDSSKL